MNLSNDAIVKMAYWEPDNGIITSQLTVNLPVKRQGRGKIVGTIIETSSEKISLNLQRKSNWFQRQCELEDYRLIFLPVSSKASLLYQGLSAMFLDPSLEAHLPSE